MGHITSPDFSKQKSQVNIFAECVCWSCRSITFSADLLQCGWVILMVVCVRHPCSHPTTCFGHLMHLCTNTLKQSGLMVFTTINCLSFHTSVLPSLKLTMVRLYYLFYLYNMLSKSLIINFTWKQQDNTHNPWNKKFFYKLHYTHTGVLSYSGWLDLCLGWAGFQLNGCIQTTGERVRCQQFVRTPV